MKRFRMCEYGRLTFPAKRQFPADFNNSPRNSSQNILQPFYFIVLLSLYNDYSFFKRMWKLNGV